MLPCALKLVLKDPSAVAREHGCLPALLRQRLRSEDHADCLCPASHRTCMAQDFCTTTSELPDHRLTRSRIQVPNPCRLGQRLFARPVQAYSSYSLRSHTIEKGDSI